MTFRYQRSSEDWIHWTVTWSWFMVSL